MAKGINLKKLDVAESLILTDGLVLEAVGHGSPKRRNIEIQP